VPREDDLEEKDFIFDERDFEEKESVSRTGIEADCGICFTDPGTRRLTFACTHTFCDTCARGHITSSMELSEFPARCPTCKANSPRGTTHPGLIAEELVQRLIDDRIIEKKVGERFIQSQVRSAIDRDSVTFCPDQKCGAMGILPSRDADMIQCQQCRKNYCHKCSVPWHQGQTCAERAGVDAKTDALLQQTSKPCPHCGTLTTHYRGHACHHIKPGEGCPRCHHHWCFACGAVSLSGTTWAKPCQCPTYCDLAGQCGCPVCPECRPGARCPHCEGPERCPSCAGIAS